LYPNVKKGDFSMTYEKRQYSLGYLLQHRVEAGMSYEDIEKRLAELPDGHPDKVHYIDQFLGGLPDDRREEFEQRLRPTA
jgi:hypothetical protein